MLEVRNLNKYYNENKSNEIHVINNTTFVLGDKGLISILGHSGSGKTTLLNSLCGIDKVDDGQIIIDGKVIEKYNAGQMDDLRNKYFGYIFQNYNLLGNQTVFENVAFSLKLLGMKDKKEIEERTMRALKVVKMDMYKNRLAKNLSGGQMQRISIARAIVKDAKVILADEATGNLDRKNTVIIMSILREIANERLVVMVTHERELAYAYSDRILEIQDGVVIKDIENVAMSEEYSYDDENLIHLGDYEKDELVKDDTAVITRYHNGNVGNVKIDFVIKDNQVFVKTSSPMEVRIIDENSLVKVDYSKKEDFKTPLIDKSEVNIEPIDKDSIKGRYRVNVFKTMFEGIIKLFQGKAGKRIILMAFLISSFLLTLSIGLLRGFGSIDETKFMTSNRDLIEVNANDIKRSTFEEMYEEMLAREDVYRITYSITDIHITTTKYEGDEETYEPTIALNALIQGVNEFNIDEELKNNLDGKSVIIDQLMVDYLLSEHAYNFQTVKTIMEQKIVINNLEYNIIGITNQGNLNVYMLDELADNLNITNSEIKIIDSLPDGYVRVPKNTFYDYYYRTEHVIYDKTFKIDKTGYLIPELDNATYALNKKTAIELYKYRMFSSINKNEESLGKAKFYVYTHDYSDFLSDYKYGAFKCTSNYNIARVRYISIYLGISVTLAIVSAIIFIAPLIMLYFLMRSSTINKIREIAIYRALGMRNRTVILTQFLELVSIISLYALPGYLFAIIFMVLTNGVLAEFSIDLITIGGSFILIFTIIVLVGLLPILRIVKKIPQKLITKYDI